MLMLRASGRKSSIASERCGMTTVSLLREVPGAGHENEDIAPAAAEVLKGR
jgi:hypothetical protein